MSVDVFDQVVKAMDEEADKEVRLVRKPTVDASMQTLEGMQAAAQALAAAGVFGQGMSAQSVLGLMLVASAEGRHPASVALDYDIIQGRAAKKSQAMMRDFQLSGGKIQWLERTEQVCRAKFSHPSSGECEVEWTMDMARRANLANKQNWVSYPRAMLSARVISEGIRYMYPGATSGMYVPEEVRDFVEIPAQDVIVEAPVPPPITVVPATYDGTPAPVTSEPPAIESYSEPAVGFPPHTDNPAEMIKYISEVLAKSRKPAAEKAVAIEYICVMEAIVTNSSAKDVLHKISMFKGNPGIQDIADLQSLAALSATNSKAQYKLGVNFDKAIDIFLNNQNSYHSLAAGSNKDRRRVLYKEAMTAVHEAGAEDQFGAAWKDDVQSWLENMFGKKVGDFNEKELENLKAEAGMIVDQMVADADQKQPGTEMVNPPVDVDDIPF